MGPDLPSAAEMSISEPEPEQRGWHGFSPIQILQVHVVTHLVIVRRVISPLNSRGTIHGRKLSPFILFFIDCFTFRPWRNRLAAALLRHCRFALPPAAADITRLKQ